MAGMGRKDKGGGSMKRIYLSGPMTGLPEHNFPAFNAEAARLRALGYDVVNPVDINPDPGKSWHECLRADLAALLTCDTLALLDGWQGSTGAHLEMHVAHRIAMPIVIAADVVKARPPEQWQIAAQMATAAIGRVLCAGGDYGDELTDMGLRRELKDAGLALQGALVDSGVRI